MSADITVLFSNLLGLFALIAVGFVAVRANIISGSASAVLTALLMKLTLPATIFTSMIRPFDPSFLRDSLLVIAISFAVFALFAILSALLCRLFRVPQGRRGMWMMCCTFCNNGFMGFPIVYSLFGEDGLALAAMISIPFNLVVYSLGVKQISLDAVHSEETPKLSLKRLLLTIVNLSVVLGLLFYCFQIPVPTAILTPIQHLANVTTPLSMMVTGINLAGGRIADALLDRDALTSSLVRLLLLPLLLWAILLPFSINPLAKSVLIVIMAMPAPAVAPVLGEQYNGCKELGARIVFLSSLLCIITLPLITLIL